MIRDLFRANRGQSSIEYLSSYGWVILIGVIALVVIWQTGLFTPVEEGRRAIGFSQLSPTDWGVSYEESQFYMRIRNDHGNDIWVYQGNLSVVVGPVKCQPIDYSMYLESGQSMNIDIDCTSTDPAKPGIRDRFEPGDNYEAEVSITYVDATTGAEHRSVGFVYGSIIGKLDISTISSTIPTNETASTTTTTILGCDKDSYVAPPPGGSLWTAVSDITGVAFDPSPSVPCDGVITLYINWTGSHGRDPNHWVFFIDNATESADSTFADVPLDKDYETQGSCISMVDTPDYAGTTYTMKVEIPFPGPTRAAELGIVDGLHNFTLYAEDKGGYNYPLETGSGFEDMADAMWSIPDFLVYNCGTSVVHPYLTCPNPNATTTGVVIFNGTHWKNETGHIFWNCSAPGWPGIIG